jgi:hypothetical protein
MKTMKKKDEIYVRGLIGEIYAIVIKEFYDDISQQQFTNWKKEKF